ncbi:hypothetical protein PO903_09395 [Paenibacillus sp. PK4536]|uniref:hypothetical protein n=1 Tax=Paenibacillus sp. PK4536 TaxID=3024576 RepID=UPI002359C082|nr:hypothetical protein [Paenibacillus sp. PK4536]WIM41059.1 hypothetical protein PO903_09395 [Paenibacillus sp. PK4536]
MKIRYLFQKDERDIPSSEMGINDWLKRIVIIAILGNIASYIWLVLTATANFQRGLDLIGTVVVVMYGTISIMTLLFTIIFLVSNTLSKGLVSNTVFISCTVVLLALSVSQFKAIEPAGWLTERIETHELVTTSDQQYQYRLELVNTFQSNEKVRLYLKHIHTGKESKIDLAIDLGAAYSIQSSDEGWVNMESTDQPHRYIMTINDVFSIPKDTFLIDTAQATSTLIAQEKEINYE